jgi:hypothetical protein
MPIDHKLYRPAALEMKGVPPCQTKYKLNLIKIFHGPLT